MAKLDVAKPDQVGPYLLLEEIGSGTMGRVFRAHDQRSGTEVAVKTLKGEATPEDVLHIKREFRLARALSSPHLVPVYELFVEANRAYLVMPLLNGRTLDVWARGDNWRQHPAHLMRVLAGMLSGVADLHSAGLVHRDVKPSNVMVAPNRDVQLLDYGLATQRTRSEVFVGSSTALFSGTLAYIPPEALYGGAATPARDAFGCGVSAFEAITNHLPPRNADTWELVSDRVRAELVAAWTDAPPTLVETVVGLLHNDPAERTKIRAALQKMCALVPDHCVAVPLAQWSESEDLIGRDQEIADIEVACQPGARIVVLGPSGIGKTSLCHAALRRWRGQQPQLLVLAGRCHPGEHLPHRAFDELIDDLTRWLSGCTPAVLRTIEVDDLAVLHEAFGVLRTVELGCGVLRPPPVGAEERRGRLAKALASLLHAVHTLFPLVMWIDDVQWADQDGLLVEVLRWMTADGPTWLLSGQELPEGYRGIEGRRIQLESLPRSCCIEIARVRAERRAHLGTKRDADALVDAAAGNPGLLCHLIDYADGPHDLTLAAVIERRVARMSSEAQLLVRAAALVGQPVPIEALLRVGGDGMRRAQHEVESLGLLRRVPFRDHAAVEVVHARLTTAIVDDISVDVAKALHRRLAETLEEVDAVPRERVAEHWHRAGEPGRASEHFEAAGRRALSALAFEHAVACFRRGLNLARGSRRAIIRPQLAQALALAGRGGEAAAMYHHAAVCAAPELARERLRAGAIQLLLAGHVDEGLTRVRRVFRDLGVRLPTSRAATMLQVAAQRQWRRVAGFRYQLQAVPKQPAADVADAAFAIGTSLIAVDPALARFVQGVHLRHGLRSGDGMRVARALALEAGFEGSVGSSPTSVSALLDGARHALGGRDEPQVRALFATTRAGIAWSSGAWRDCVAAAQDAERIAEEELIGARWELNFARSVLLDALRWMGRYEELGVLTRRYLDDAARRGDRFSEVTFRTRFATSMHLVGDRPKQAWAACTGGAEWRARGVHLQHLAELHARTECLLYNGRTQAALTFAERRYQDIRWSLLMTLPAPRAKVFHQLGACRLARAQELAGGARARLLHRVGDAIGRLKAAPWDYTSLLGEVLQAGLDHLSGACVRSSLHTLAEWACTLEMNQLAHALRLAGAVLDHDGRARQEHEHSIRALGVQQPARWAAVLVPGLMPNPPMTAS